MSAPPRSAGRRGSAPVLAALLLGLTACGSGDASRPRVENVLLFSVDTLRADLLGCYGNPHMLTPAADSLAAEGLRFEHAYAQATMTNESLTSILTGLLPPQHGVRDQTSGYASGVVALPTLARDAGLATGSFVANMCQLQSSERTIWHDGWHERFCGMRDRPEDYSDQYLWDEAVVSAGLEWIDAQSGPWMAWMHLMDPHAEHRPPPRRWDYGAKPLLGHAEQYAYYNRIEEAGQMPADEVVTQIRDLYAAEVAGADDQLERTLAALRSRDDWDRTAVVFFADHGEELFETLVRYGHGMALTEGVLHVPLILRAPGVEPGTYALPVEALQITPTVLELLEIEAPYELSGTSLLDERPSPGYAMSYAGKIVTTVRGPSMRFWHRHTNTPYVREFAPWKTDTPWFREDEVLATYESDADWTPTWIAATDPSADRPRNRLRRSMTTRHEALLVFGEGVRIRSQELLEQLERTGYVDPLELGTDD